MAEHPEKSEADLDGALLHLGERMRAVLAVLAMLSGYASAEKLYAITVKLTPPDLAINLWPPEQGATFAENQKHGPVATYKVPAGTYFLAATTGKYGKKITVDKNMSVSIDAAKDKLSEAEYNRVVAIIGSRIPPMTDNGHLLFRQMASRLQATRMKCSKFLSGPATQCLTTLVPVKSAKPAVTLSNQWQQLDPWNGSGAAFKTAGGYLYFVSVFEQGRGSMLVFTGE